MEIRRVVVTGAASGIGQHLVSSLRARGVQVVGLDQVPSSDGDAPTLSCDVTSEADVEAALGEAAASMGGIDAIVNCAGVGAEGSIEDADADDWMRVFEVNVVGLARVTRLALPWLRESGGAIVNIGSVAADRGLPRRAVYTASKGAVQSLSRAMAADLLADGVSVVCVNPGTADTPWVSRLLTASGDPEGERTRLERRQPIGRLVAPQEVVETVLLGLGPARHALTGSSIAVDGGMTALSAPVRAGSGHRP